MNKSKEAGPSRERCAHRRQRGSCRRHTLCPVLIKETGLQGFPGGPVVKNLPASSEDVGSIPGSGGPQMPWGNKARAPQLLSPSPCPKTGEWPPLATAGESPGVAAKTQCSQKQSRRSSKLPKVRFGENFMGRR